MRQINFQSGTDIFRGNFFFLSVIIGISLGLRFYFFPYGLPLTLDSLVYFWYANDMSILGHMPNYSASNNGWPVFLSVFFSIFHFDKPFGANPTNPVLKRCPSDKAMQSKIKEANAQKGGIEMTSLFQFQVI